MDTQTFEKPQRSHRVNFGQPVRVVPIGGPPRAYRVFAGNLSRDGMFLKMAEPFEAGTRLALSLEAKGRVLPFAQGEVVWRGLTEFEKQRTTGLGIRFTGFLHPRADELVDYLVSNIETGEPLELAPEVPYWKRSPVRAVAIAAGIVGLVAGGMFAMMTGTNEPIDAEPAIAAPAVAEAPAPAAFKPVPLKAPVAVAVLAPPVKKVTLMEEIDLRPSSSPAKTTPQKTEAEKPATPGALDRTVPLPQSSVKSVRLVEKNERVDLTFRLEDNAKVVEVFRMSNPDRLVVDLSGRAPAKSHRVGLNDGTINAVRLGRGEKGTRLVFDLSAPLKVIEHKGNRIALGR